MDVSVLRRFNTIGWHEKLNVLRAMRYPLSGYLGGLAKAGYWCTRLADEWKAAFGVTYAVPCNSATSGLLAACMAARIGPGDTVWTTAYSMSATAACAKVLGAHLVFIDVEMIRFSLNLNMKPAIGLPKCIIVTNLFGHPAYLSTIRSWCDSNKVIMIEDNAQAPFAMEGKRYAGTVGHFGVFSLNVHKHIQCGEGGVVVTQSQRDADAVAGAINHGELAGLAPGLNLRMTETTAAIACAQLKKAPAIIESRRILAHELNHMVSDIPWIEPPKEDVDCKHVYYMWAAIIHGGKRDVLHYRLCCHGLPFEAGYATPLNYIFGDGGSGVRDKTPVADSLQDRYLLTFWICGYDPTRQQLKKLNEIIHTATRTL